VSWVHSREHPRVHSDERQGLGTIKDTRQPWKVAYPLREVLFLVVCGTIACGDDYDDIVDWGEAHLSLRKTSACISGRATRESVLSRPGPS